MQHSRPLEQSRIRRWITFFWLAGTFVVISLLAGDRIAWWMWKITPWHNINLEEALAWHRGTFSLQGPQREAAVYDGRPLNAFPPAFTFVSYLVTGASHLITGEYKFPAWVFRLLLGPPTILLAWWSAGSCTKKPWQALILTVSLIVGTPVQIMLVLCRIGGFFEVNHLLACWGLFLIAGDLLGRQRIWPALIGFALAFWSRQLTVTYAVWILWAVARRPARERKQWMIVSLVAFGAIFGAYALLNALKFGSPLETGYRYIYAQRSDAIARRAKLGLFRPEYIPDNFHFMMIQPPGVRITKNGIEKNTNDFGSAVWMTCPILLGVVVTLPHWWRDKSRRTAMLLSFIVLAALLMYHNTGWRQPGYYRFCLDFVPIWMMVMAPYLWGRIGTPLVVASTVWSVWYFRLIAPTDFSWAGL